MRQHAIPQNVLDVEFKLFTKYTIKEFIYIASGFGFGGIFLYLWTENILSGIISWPIFIFSAGTGLMLGLVPINDQPADKFITNYINAIKRPTQRVWLNKEFKDKLDLVAQEKGLTLNKIDVKNQQKVEIKKEAKIITEGDKENIHNTTKEVDQLDLEENQRLKKIDILFEETGLIPKQQKSLNLNKNTLPEEQQIPSLLITNETINQYILPNTSFKPSGTFNIILRTKNNEPIGNATVIIKGQDQKPIIAMKSAINGEVLTNKILPPGEYNIEISHEQAAFPEIKFITTEKIYPLIKINSI